MLIAHFIEDGNQHFSAEQIQEAFLRAANQSLADMDFCQEFANNVKQAEETETCSVTKYGTIRTHSLHGQTGGHRTTSK